MSKMLHRQRKRIAVGLGVTSLLLGYWLFFSNGLPVYWGPSANAKDIAAGRELFEHEWTPNDPLAHGDGLGPVFNAKSCAACHFQGGLGGGGEISHNATAFEILPRPGRTELVSGTIHNYSVEPGDRESFSIVRKLFPVNRAVTTSRSVAMANCPPTIQTTTADFDPLRTISTQSSAMFGSGWIDLIAEKAIVQNFRRRSFQEVTKELAMNFNGVPLGRLRKLPDGRIGRFGWKGQFATLKEFTAVACANEIGLGTPITKQTMPVVNKAKADVPADLDDTQFGNLVAFVKTLPVPISAALRASIPICCCTCSTNRCPPAAAAAPTAPNRCPSSPAPKANRRRPTGALRRCGALPTRPPTSTTAPPKPCTMPSSATTATPKA